MNCAHCVLLGIVHLNVGTDKCIEISFVGGQVLDHWVINFGLDIVIEVLKVEKHTVIVLYFVLTDLHVIVYTSVELRSKVIGLVILLNRCGPKMSVFKVRILYN